MSTSSHTHRTRGIWMTHERKEITRKLAASAETPDRARLDLSLCVDHALDWGGTGVYSNHA